MEFSGTQMIGVGRDTVWAYLQDVQQVAPCAPGFQSLEQLGPEHWKAVVAVTVGPVKAKFTMDVTRPEMQAPDLMVVRGRGKAPAGNVELEGKMHLLAVGEAQTQMDWQAHVVVSGTLASVGARLMNSSAEKLTGQFFSCLRERLQASGSSSSTGDQ